MTSVREIEHAIKKLPQKDYLELAKWMEDYDLERSSAGTSARIAEILDEEDGGGSQLTDE